MQRSLLHASKDLLSRSFKGQAPGRLKNIASELQGTKICDRSNTICDQHLWLWAMSNRLRLAYTKINSSLSVLSVLFAKQCNAIAAQRIRRSIQIVNLYCRLYEGQSQWWKRLVEKLAKQGHRLNGKPVYFLFSAALFSWDKERITDDDVDKQIWDLKNIVEAKKKNESEVKGLEGWEKIIDREKLTTWRKPVGDGYLYEYKVFGTFRDIPARAFFNIQVDLEYRKKWDKLVIKLDVVDHDATSDCEIVQWITHFPFPMYSREYVYMRRCVVDPQRKVMLVMSHAVDHPSCPMQDKFVRVHTFRSQMVIKPHRSFDENGFDYVLTYYDDPQAAFPSAAYNWMASTGVPDFVDKLHVAAKRMMEQTGRGEQDYNQPDQSPIPI